LIRPIDYFSCNEEKNNNFMLITNKLLTFFGKKFQETTPSYFSCLEELESK